MKKFEASSEMKEKMLKDDEYIEEMKYINDYNHLSVDQVGGRMIEITSKMEKKWGKLGDNKMIVDEEHRKDRLEYYKLKNVLMRRTIKSLLKEEEEQ